MILIDLRTSTAFLMSGGVRCLNISARKVVESSTVSFADIGALAILGSLLGKSEDKIEFFNKVYNVKFFCNLDTPGEAVIKEDLVRGLENVTDHM